MQEWRDGFDSILCEVLIEVLNHQHCNPSSDYCVKAYRTASILAAMNCLANRAH